MYLVNPVELRQAKNKSHYLVTRLANKDKSINVNIWKNAKALEERLNDGLYIYEEEPVEDNKGYYNIEIGLIKKVDKLPDELDLSVDGEVIWAKIEPVFNSFQNKDYSKLINQVFSVQGVKENFLVAPAAKNYHGNYKGGLIEHVFNMLRIAGSKFIIESRLNVELLLTGIILHDIGKISCYKQLNEFAFDHKVENKAISHIPIGYAAVTEACVLAKLPLAFKLEIGHMILAHHGRLEWGSPIEPQTSEAEALHLIDMLEARVNTPKREFSFEEK